MGAATSKMTNNDTDNSSIEKLHKIATEYILTQNHKDLVRLVNPEQCNKLVILSSQNIKKFIPPRIITYIYDHLLNKRDEKMHFFMKDDE